MSNMRELVLAEIDRFRAVDNFSRGTMRWNHFYLHPVDGLIISRSNKQMKRLPQVIHLDETRDEHFEMLTDGALLSLLVSIVRQASKQM